MDNSITTIILLILSIFVFVGIISIALFVTSDDFQEFMEEEDKHEELQKKSAPQISPNVTNSSTQFVQSISWKRSTVKKVLGIMGFDTEKKDSVYESKAMVYATTKMVTTFLIIFGIVLGSISAIVYLNQQFRKT